MIQELDTTQNEIEVFPYGLSVGAGLGLPVMIFQDAADLLRIPVYLRPTEATASLTYLDEPASLPFGLWTELLEQLEVRIEKCVLDRVQGHQQFGTVYFSGPKNWRVQALKRPADEVVSVGLIQGARFFVTPEFTQHSREMKIEILESVIEGPMLSEHARRFLM